VFIIKHSIKGGLIIADIRIWMQNVWLCDFFFREGAAAALKFF